MSQQNAPSTGSLSLERISRLVSDLEQELMAAPADSTQVLALRAELALLKRTLSATEGEAEVLRRQLQGTHSKLDDLIASVEGAVLKDTPYLTELGRILGLI
jgi:hypothetical protein